MANTTRRLVLVSACAALAWFAGSAVSQDAATPASGETAAAHTELDFSKLMQERSPSLVTIRFILREDDDEQEVETVGTIVAQDGLVITSNLNMGGMNAMFGGAAAQPTQIKVLIGTDTQGVDATLVARDSELGLAWVKIDEPREGGYAFVNFDEAPVVALGDRIYTLQILGKFFDRAMSVSEGRVGAMVSKPRELLIPSVGLAGGEQGLPVFNASGQPVGLSTIILPAPEEMMGGGRDLMRGALAGMVLPAAQVADATRRARETAATTPPAGEEPAQPATDAPAGGN